MKGKHNLKKMNDYIAEHGSKAHYDRDQKRLIFEEVKNASNKG